MVALFHRLFPSTYVFGFYSLLIKFESVSREFDVDRYAIFFP